MDRLIFTTAVAILAFGGGLLAAHFESFPYPQAMSAAKTARSIVFGGDTGAEGRYIVKRDVPHAEIASARWERATTGGADRSVLVFGGRGQFLDICPQTGCAGVRYDASGTVVESWPLLLDDIMAADGVAGEYPRESLSYLRDAYAYPTGVNRYPDGDLQIIFQAAGSVFPFGWGIARIAPDGTPRWYRNDYSHHWAHMLDDGTTLTPTLRVGDGPIPVTVGYETPDTPPTRRDIDCVTGRPQIDTMAIIAPDGTLRREIELLEPMLASHFTGLLSETTDPCDPLHLNYIDVVEAGDADDLPRKVVLSFRNISAFGVFDLESGTYDGIYAGSFVRQHSVHHLGGTQFVMFDNLGGDASGGGSRVLVFDTATMAERVVFPQPDTPGIFSRNAGHIDLSPDRRSVLVSFSAAGQGVEVDIATGAVLSTFTNVHPLVGEGGEDAAALYRLYGMSYEDD